MSDDLLAELRGLQARRDRLHKGGKGTNVVIRDIARKLPEIIAALTTARDAAAECERLRAALAERLTPTDLAAFKAALLGRV